MYTNFIGAKLYCSVQIESSETDIFEAVVEFSETRSERQSSCIMAKKKKKKFTYQV